MGRRFVESSGGPKPAPPPRSGVGKEEKERRKEKKRSRRKREGRSKENMDSCFPRQTKDGSTSLTIVSPGDGVVPGTEKDRPVSLGNLIGRVRVGTSYLYGFREDKRNIVKAMYPINYNFYSSYGPSYDSTFSNLTLEETQLVQTGDKFINATSKQYTDLIRNVCLEDYTHTFVDHLIDILEGKEVKDQEVEPSDDITDLDQIDFEALRSLSEEGLDMSFLESLKLEYDGLQEPGESLEQRLDLTAQLIHNLKTSQTARLSVCPTNSLNQVEQPSQAELMLANEVLDNLTALLQSTKPGDVVSVAALHRTMGVRVVPGEGADNREEGEVEINSGN